MQSLYVTEVCNIIQCSFMKFRSGSVWWEPNVLSSIGVVHISKVSQSFKADTRNRATIWLASSINLWYPCRW